MESILNVLFRKQKSFRQISGFRIGRLSKVSFEKRSLNEVLYVIISA